MREACSAEGIHALFRLPKMLLFSFSPFPLSFSNILVLLFLSPPFTSPGILLAHGGGYLDPLVTHRKIKLRNCCLSSITEPQDEDWELCEAHSCWQHEESCNIKACKMKWIHNHKFRSITLCWNIIRHSFESQVFHKKSAWWGERDTETTIFNRCASSIIPEINETPGHNHLIRFCEAWGACVVRICSSIKISSLHPLVNIIHSTSTCLTTAASSRRAANSRQKCGISKQMNMERYHYDWCCRHLG